MIDTICFVIWCVLAGGFGLLAFTGLVFLIAVMVIWAPWENAESKRPIDSLDWGKE